MKTAITPGEILLEDYLVPMGISQNALARALGISPRSINEIVLGRRSITPEMSLKLGKFLNKALNSGSTFKPPVISANCSKKKSKSLRR